MESSFIATKSNQALSIKFQGGIMKIRVENLFFFLLLFTFISSCTTTSRHSTSGEPLDPNGNPIPPKNYFPAIAKQLTFSGINTNPSFSKGGKHIVFLSKERPKHKNQQAYSMSLDKNQVRRVTHNDAQVYHVSFYLESSKEILYSSNTDERKERPDLLFPDDKNKPESKFPKSEIYFSYKNGRFTQRITKSPFFDGLAISTSKGNIIYSKAIGNQRKLWTYTRSSKKHTPLLTSKHDDSYPQISFNGKMITWERTLNKKHKVIMTSTSNGNKSQFIPNTANSSTPSWHPNGKKIIFSSNDKHSKNTEIYIINTNGTCKQRLTYNKGEDLHPRFNSDGSHIIFSSNRSGTFQVYSMAYTPPKSCPEDIKTVK